MSKVEEYKCDLCGEVATMEFTIVDRVYQKVVKRTDLCQNHFKRIQSYIRNGCPLVSDIAKK